MYVRSIAICVLVGRLAVAARATGGVRSAGVYAEALAASRSSNRQLDGMEGVIRRGAVGDGRSTAALEIDAWGGVCRNNAFPQRSCKFKEIQSSELGQPARGA